MAPRTTSRPSAYGRSKEVVEMSFVDLVWMLQEVPLGTPNALPALGSPLPWYILPAPLAKSPCPWTRDPNDATRRLESIHREAGKRLRELEKAKRDARDPAELRAEANRKKKARKLASKARKEASAGETPDAAEQDGDGPEAEVEGDEQADVERADVEREGTAQDGASAQRTTPKRVPTAPKVAYALPAYLSPETQAAFVKQYEQVHVTWTQQRWDEAEVVLPKHLKSQAVWGNAYIYPQEHKDDPQRGLVLNQDTLTFEYHTE